ncbi:hypothetical protein OG871_05715 [Kitasatospora sp. NBC_00374]
MRLPVAAGDDTAVVRIKLRLPADLTVMAPPCITMPETETDEGRRE